MRLLNKLVDCVEYKIRSRIKGSNRNNIGVSSWTFLVRVYINEMLHHYKCAAEFE